MQEPGLRRLREGARIGLFKNKVGRVALPCANKKNRAWCCGF
jgi:hypothetical protein